MGALNKGALNSLAHNILLSSCCLGSECKGVIVLQGIQASLDHVLTESSLLRPSFDTLYIFEESQAHTLRCHFCT